MITGPYALLIAPLIVFTQLLIAEFFMLYKCTKKKFFILRTIFSVALCLSFSWLWYFFPYAWMNVLNYFILFFVTWIPLYLCFCLSISEIIYWSIAALAIQHIIYCLTSIFNLVLPQFSFSFTPMILISIFVYLMEYIFIIRNIKSNYSVVKSSYRYILIIAAIVMVVAEFLNSLKSIYSNNMDPSLGIITNIFSIICCSLCLVLQFGIVKRFEIENELNTIKTLWHNDKKQFESSEKSIELLNMYCHDLKHIMNNSTNAKVTEALEIYDSIINTQNHALDVILTEKSLYCKTNNITLTCIADGQKLNHIKTSDLYSIFGNILNNAIEAVSPLQNSEQRTISLLVGQKQDFVYIHSENYFEGQLNIVNGLPVTSKKDKKIHGYGLKSVKFYVERYNGNLTINVKDNIFYLNILIPIGETSL